jgi:hypothetical protein
VYMTKRGDIFDFWSVLYGHCCLIEDRPFHPSAT